MQQLLFALIQLVFCNCTRGCIPTTTFIAHLPLSTSIDKIERKATTYSCCSPIDNCKIEIRSWTPSHRLSDCWKYELIMDRTFNENVRSSWISVLLIVTSPIGNFFASLEVWFFELFFKDFGDLWSFENLNLSKTLCVTPWNWTFELSQCHWDSCKLTYLNYARNPLRDLQIVNLLIISKLFFSFQCNICIWTCEPHMSLHFKLFSFNKIDQFCIFHN